MQYKSRPLWYCGIVYFGMIIRTISLRSWTVTYTVNKQIRYTGPSVAGVIFCTKQTVVQHMREQTLGNVADCCAPPCMKL